MRQGFTTAGSRPSGVCSTATWHCPCLLRPGEVRGVDGFFTSGWSHIGTPSSRSTALATAWPFQFFLGATESVQWRMMVPSRSSLCDIAHHRSCMRSLFSVLRPRNVTAHVFIPWIHQSGTTCTAGSGNTAARGSSDRAVRGLRRPPGCLGTAGPHRERKETKVHFRFETGLSLDVLSLAGFRNQKNDHTVLEVKRKCDYINLSERFWSRVTGTGGFAPGNRCVRREVLEMLIPNNFRK